MRNFPISYRLPSLIGTLLIVSSVVSIWAAYSGVKNAALQVGGERLQSLTEQLAAQSQQALPVALNRTAAVASDKAIRSFLEAPSPATRIEAVATLKQFSEAQDPNSLQVELWDATHSLALTLPESSLPRSPNPQSEFKLCAVDPFKAAGPIQVINGVIVYPVVAAAKDEAGRGLGCLIRWRRVSPASNARKQLADLLGSQAALYYGNPEGDVWTDLEKIVPKPPEGLQSTLQIAHYQRDGKSVMALGRPIVGTPWFLVVEFPEAPLLSQAHGFLRRMIVIGLAIVGIGLLGAFFLSRSITRPLHALATTASAISAGDYSQTVEVDRGDELGTLATAFNAMLLQTRDVQKDLELQLQERTLQLEAAPCAMLMVDERGLVTLVNSQAELLFGYNRSELLDQPIEMLVPERYRTSHPGHRAFFTRRPKARAMGAGRDLFGLRKDGTEVPIEIGLNPIQTPAGAFVLASIIDITERKRAEERFRMVVDASPSALLMINEHSQITLANAQADSLFGYERTELLDRNIEMLVPERYRAAHPGLRANFFHTPSTRPMGGGRDLFGLRKDGSEIPIEIGLNPIRMPDGAFVLASIIDISERKRVEQVARESEERLHTVIESLSEGLVISDLDGQLIHWNRVGWQMHGFSSMEECLLKIPEFQEIFELSTLDGRVLKVDEWPLPRVMAGETLVDYEVCLRRLNSDWKRIFSYGGTIVKEPNGQRLAFVTTMDVTERKQAEENVLRSQRQLSGIIASAMDAVITVDAEQRIVLFNNAAERMFLFPAEDTIGQPLERFIPERFRAAHKGHIETFGDMQVTRRSMGSLGALFGLRADGEEFPIEASISQIESEGRKLYTVILRDISERKRAEEALKEQTRILDLAHVLIRDLNDRIIFWNTGAEQMYGWTAAEALEKVTHTLFQTEHPQPIEELKAKLFARNHWEGELVHTRKDGQKIVVASHWVLHRDENDKPKAILEVNNDVTERKQAEREVRRLNEELEQRVADRTTQLEAANKELEAFSYSVSHDLRAPLRHINGFSQALLEDYEDKLDEGGKNYLYEVRSASQEMAQLIDDVLQLARVTRSEMRREKVDLSELARNVVNDLKKMDGDRVVEVCVEEGMVTQGDRRLLRIVLTNLLGNAWKFTSKREQAEISFGREPHNGETPYFVRDNGAGFDMAYTSKLFGAFQRLHSAGEFEGTGIGLATVQRIVNRHGGRVWAEAKAGEGATFYFALPNFKEQGDERQSDSTG